jgi:uncharacterized repeat protein (TIGR01451 family)
MGQVGTSHDGQSALAAAAALAGGDISLDFIADGHNAYNHTTGVGGTYGNRSIGPNGVEESLEGQDFACGDKVVYFVAVTVDNGATSGAIDLNLSWDGTTTSGSRVGINDLVSATLNSPDAGNHNLDGNETVSIQSETGPPPNGEDVEATVRVTNLDGGEQLIVRLVTNLWCDFTETHVTGNIHANLDSASVVGGSKISVGAQTVPLKQAGNILFPGLNVLKSCPPSGTVGDQITYTITVQNTGQDVLNNIQVNDTILGSLSGSFADSLAGGASESHTFPYTLTASPDPITNVVTATATAAQSSTTLTDTADCTTDVLFPDLSIDKTADDATVSAGDPIGYTITVHNAGPGTAFDVEMTDTLPANPGLSWSVESTTGGWSCGIALGVLTCGGQGFDLASGASASVHITSPTTSATCGTVSNTGIVDASNDTQVSTGIVTITVECASLVISKVADDSVVKAGHPIGYTITVTNNGAGTAKGVVVTDTLPTNAGLSWSIDGGTGAAQCGIANGVLTCNFGDMAPGASLTVHLTSPTTAETCGEVINAASASSTNDGNPSTGPVTIIVNCPDLGIDIEKGGPELAHVGDTITYDFTVQLTTPEPLFNVTVTDPNCNEGAPVYVSGDTNTNDVLEPGEVWNYTCTHLVTAQDPDPLPNTATVVGASEDGRTTTDKDSHEVDLIHPGIQIVKTVNPVSGEPGDTVTFTYVVTNTGDTTLFNVSVDDDVIGHIGDIAELAAGETVTLTKDWVLPANAPFVTNVGTATGTDVLEENVSDDDDATVTIVEANNPPKPPPPTAFTGSDALRLGLLTLALLALGSIALVIGRRRGRNEAV